MTAPTPSDFATYRRRRVSHDLYARALIGPPFYLVGSLLIWLAGEFPPRMAVFLLCTAAVFGLLWELRRRNRLPPDESALPRWEARQWALVLIGYAVWALLVALLGVAEQVATVPVLIALLATAAFAAAGAATFTSALWRQRQFMLLLASPFVLVWMPFYPELRIYAWVLLIYLLYCLLLGRRLHTEYETHIRLEHELQVSRAEVEALARTDALTGLWNRREYETIFAAAWQRRSRNISPLSLIILDLDDFKQVNDRHGHHAGDLCLRHAANLLRRHFRRSNDSVARIGGEEFAVVLPDTERAEAVQLAEDFRCDLERTPCLTAAGAIAITASIGVGEINMAQDASPDASFARIDKACYEAKQGGRNAVVKV